MKSIKRLLFIAGCLCLAITMKSQDTLKLERFKDIGTFLTTDFNRKYPNLGFLKYRLISPVANIFDTYKGNASDPPLDFMSYFGLVNDLDLANLEDDPKINLSYVQSKFLEYSKKQAIPISLSFIEFYTFKDSALGLGYIDFQDNKYVDNSPPDFFPFEKDLLFAASVLNGAFDQPRVDFYFSNELILSNMPVDDLNDLYVDFDDGNGYQILLRDQIMTANYIEDGTKTIKVKAIVNGKSFISSSTLSINTQNYSASMSSCTTPVKAPDAGPFPISTNKLGTNVTGEFAVWFSTCNSSNLIRKPFIISAGYNPGNGKQLLAGLINVSYMTLNFPIQQIFPNIPSIQIPVDFEWNGAWRGTFYETYNGVYNKRFSETEFSQCGAADNSNHFLDRLRDEGYDVIILSYDDGKDRAIDNAALFMELIETINTQKTNNGFAFENVVCGFSSGAITTRLALALMESRFKQGIGPHPHTKEWVSFEGEHQGANVPLGFQHFLRFQKDAFYTIPSLNLLKLQADLANQVVATIAYNNVDTDNAFELLAYNAAVAGNGPHSKRTTMLNQLATVPLNNANGYPEFSRRIGVSQGSGIGTNVPHNSSAMLDSYLGTDLSGTAVSFPSTCGGSYQWVAPKCIKTTTAKWWTNSNPTIFDGEVRLDASFTILPKTCVNFPFVGCQCMGPLTMNLPIQIKQTHIATPNYLTSNYDDAPASTLSSHIEVYKQSLYPFYNNALNGQAYANWDPQLHGFTPTTSGLDLHDPNNGYAAGNNFMSPQSLNLLNIKPLNLQSPQEPNFRHGYPYIAHPNDHYQITPFDAVYNIGNSNGTFVGGGNKPGNQIHVEDPQEYIGDFLSRIEIAPENLYLSNRNLAATQSNYKAEFEARSRILAGRTDETGLQSIYSKYVNQHYLTPDGNFVVDQNSKAIFHAGDLVELLPGFEVTLGAELDAYIQSYNCANNMFRVRHDTPEDGAGSNGYNASSSPEKNSQSEKMKKAGLTVYPNPNSGIFDIEYVSADKESKVQVLDLTGKVVAKETIPNNQAHQLNLQSLESGIYLIMINTSTQTEKFKLVISK